MKYSQKHEDWRSRYARLLCMDCPFKLTLEDSEELDLLACKNLINEDFMIGDTCVGAGESQGYELLEVRISEVTLKGRIFADEQMKYIQENSILGKAGKYIAFVLGWVAAVIGSVVTHYLTAG